MNEGDDDLGSVTPMRGLKLGQAKPQETPQGLFQGDMIVAQVTHEVEAYGNRMWVRFGASTTVQPGEGTEAARTRLMDQVRIGVEKSVLDNVRHAQEMSE